MRRNITGMASQQLESDTNPPAAEGVKRRVATTLVVFSRGVDLDATGRVLGLNRASQARVRAAMAYVAEHATTFRSAADTTDRGRLVFTGGWAAAASDLPAPPREQREGQLMADMARDLGIEGEQLSTYVDIFTENESVSTLENVLRLREGRYLDGGRFDESRPLGLVAHKEHIGRISYFLRKVFDLRRRAIHHVVADGPDNRSRDMPEALLRPLTRLACFGATSPGALRHRERLLVNAARLTGKLRPTP